MAYRKLIPMLIAIPAVAGLSVPCIWAVFYFGVYLGYGNYKVRGHQEFAANGVSQIQPASEMNQLYTDCRHFITYGPNETPLFNSVAYFDNRYVLTMQVAVRIRSASCGAMVDIPHFYLDEVASVTVFPSGQVGANVSRNLDFSSAEWEQVYGSGGNFGTIGFNVNTTPVPNFRQYADADRPSN